MTEQATAAVEKLAVSKAAWVFLALWIAGIVALWFLLHSDQAPKMLRPCHGCSDEDLGLTIDEGVSANGSAKP